MIQDTPVTDRDFAALFREEAGSILTEQQNKRRNRTRTNAQCTGSKSRDCAKPIPRVQSAALLQRHRTQPPAALLSVSPFKRSDRSCQCTASYLLSFVGGTQTDRLSSGRGLLCLRYCLRLFLRHFVYLPPQTSHTA